MHDATRLASMDKKPFQIMLTPAQRELLEGIRARLGYRSQADVIRQWILRDVAEQLEERETQDA